MADKSKITQAMTELRKRHLELDDLMDYPPFNDIDDGIGGWDSDGKTPQWGFPIRTERGHNFAESMQAAFKKISMDMQDGDIELSIIDTLFDELEEEFKDDLAEARLYKKRHPNNYVEALIQAHKTVEK